MGWQEVRVLAGGLDGFELETGLPDPHAQVRTLAGLPEISIKELSTRLDAGDGVVVLDFADSHSYAAGHIPGAWFAIRARLPESLPKLPDGVLHLYSVPLRHRIPEDSTPWDSRAHASQRRPCDILAPLPSYSSSPPF